MRFIVLAIVLAIPAADLYLTARIARWSGIPLWVWLGGSFVAVALLLNTTNDWSGMVRNICFANAKSYLGLALA